MDVSLFDYHLPKERIAQKPKRPREAARLLCLDRRTGAIQHLHVSDFISLIRPSDVIVFNDSKVFKARLLGKKETGGMVEVFLLRPQKGRSWEVLLGGKRTHEGSRIYFSGGISCVLIKKHEDCWTADFSVLPSRLISMCERIGQTPTPPYIKTKAAANTYQTVYANPRKIGSVAAPTAGFHFSKSTLRALKDKSADIQFVTLHVGIGTFAPVKEKDITKHVMHAEYAEVDAATLSALRKAKRAGKRIIAVGTTTVRTLEAAFSTNEREFSGFISSFIYPGYTFTGVDAMLTNFHLPKSTLLMLVSAFAGRKHVLRAYRAAVRKNYRFYSFGDAMFIS